MNPNKVLAEVNGRKITQQDAYAFLNQLDPQIAMQFQSPEGINRIVDELVNQELMYLDAVENNFDKEEIFISEIEKIKANALKQYAMNKLLSDVSATEEEIAKYYDDHKQYFKRPEAVRASHILVKEKDKALEILKEINEGLSFEEAASKYSTCPSKENGGDLGEFTKGKMVPEFEEAAFSIEEGKVSNPVKTQFGYHLIKVKYKKEAGDSTLEEVKDQITQQVIGMKQQEIYMGKTEALRRKYEIKINY
jgi:peptidyl-prolyl cis-trans isomerase C